MNLIDGLIRGRPVIPDSSTTAKSGGGGDAVSNAASGAVFGDVLSEVSKRDGGLGGSSAASTSQAIAISTSTRESASAKIGVVTVSESRLRPSDGTGTDGAVADAAALNAPAADSGSPYAAPGIAPTAGGQPVPHADDSGGQAPRRPPYIPQTDVAASSGSLNRHAVSRVDDKAAVEAVKSTEAVAIKDGRPAALDTRLEPRSRTSEADTKHTGAPSRKRDGDGTSLVSPSLAGASSDVSSGQITNIPVNNGASAAPWSGIAPYQRSIDAMSVAPSIQPSRGRGDADVPRVPKSATAGAIAVRSSMDLAAAQPSAAAVAMKSPSTPLRAPAPSGGAVATFEETEAAPFQATALGERAAALAPPNLPSAPRPQGRQTTPGLSAPPGNAPPGMPATDLTPTPEESTASFSTIAAASPRVGQSTGFPERGQIKVAVLDRQSHFPPTAGFSPIHQIADRIAPEAASLVSSLGEAAEPGASSGASPAAGVSDATQSQVLPTVMKSLNLQLEPETLGAVTIRMRLSGSRLEVQVEPARADTMRLISDDKDRLAEKLRSSAYTLDGVVVKLAGQQSPHLQQGADPTTSSDTQRDVPTSWRPSQQGSWSADDQSGAQRESASSQQRARDDSEDRSSGVNSGGAVYL